MDTVQEPVLLRFLPICLSTFCHSLSKGHQISSDPQAPRGVRLPVELLRDVLVMKSKEEEQHLASFRKDNTLKAKRMPLRQRWDMMKRR